MKIETTNVIGVTRNFSGLVILEVEAKVDETFGPTIEEKKSKASEGQLSRISYLEGEIGRTGWNQTIERRFFSMAGNFQFLKFFDNLTSAYYFSSI
jgi:hypothetical protein